MANALNLYVAVYTKLTSVQTVGSFYDDVGGRIRFVKGQQDEQTPLCVVRHGTMSLFREYTSPDDVDLVFGIDLYVDTESTASLPFLPETLVATLDKLMTLLDRTTITATGYSRCQALFQSIDTIDRDGDAWVITTSWKLTATPTS